MSGAKNSAGLVRSRAKPPPPGEKSPVGQKGGEGGLLKLLTNALPRPFHRGASCRRMSFPAKGHFPHSRLALTTIKSVTGPRFVAT